MAVKIPGERIRLGNNCFGTRKEMKTDENHNNKIICPEKFIFSLEKFVIAALFNDLIWSKIVLKLDWIKDEVGIKNNCNTDQYIRSSQSLDHRV